MLAITSLLSAVGPTTHDPSPPSLTVIEASVQQAAELEVAVQRFVNEELTLPELRVRYSPEPDGCYGHLGTFTRTTTPWTITICSDLAFVPTHELAHAWLETNLDTATRRSYLRARHKASWNDKQADWSERGVEDAAFIIQQNLMITPPSPLTPEWQARAAAYELLTGRPSPLRRTGDLDVGPSIIIDSASPDWTDGIQWGSHASARPASVSRR